MLNQIMEALATRRMMSIGNLAIVLESEPDALAPHLEELETQGRIRHVLSSCSGSCSTCSSSCSSEESEGAAVPDASFSNPTAIVISMERRAEEE